MPILTAPISPHLFVLPEHTNFMPFLPSDIYDIHKLQVIRKKEFGNTWYIRPYPLRCFI